MSDRSQGQGQELTIEDACDRELDVGDQGTLKWKSEVNMKEDLCLFAVERGMVVPFVGEEQLNVSPTVAARRYLYSTLIY